jgi:hypothetical protein
MTDGGYNPISTFVKLSQIGCDKRTLNISDGLVNRNMVIS